MECIDKDYLNKVLNDIKEALNVMRKAVSIDIDIFVTDPGLKYMLRHAIVVIVEAIIDLGTHILVTML